MSVTLTGFREAVQAELAADLGITIYPGMMKGPVVRHSRGSVWVVGKREAEDNVDDELIELRVRVFQAYLEQRDPTVPVNPDPLETLADAVVASLADKQTTLGPWFTRVTSVELDMETQGVEVTVIGRQSNTFLNP